ALSGLIIFCLLTWGFLLGTLPHPGPLSRGGEGEGTLGCFGFLFLQEQFPLGDVVRVADECRYWQFLRRARDAEQLQVGFMRQAVSLARVHFLAGSHEVFPCVRITARARQDVIQAAFVRTQHLAGVLATVAVAFADRARAELRALL